MVTIRICRDLKESLDSLLKDGYRLEMIMPADDPRDAIVSKYGQKIRLASTADPKPDRESVGRAGMEYRDLIPGRLDGKVIASHIRLTTGGEVPDYIHYHKIDFQMIYCKTGWIKVVYEDQGPPFLFNAGDCILQPPEIRHRVLESSAGAEVIEVTSPALHETWVEHDLKLPTNVPRPGRSYRGQRFVRFVGSQANWKTEPDGSKHADTGISEATGGLGSVKVIRMTADCHSQLGSDERQQFIFVLNGRIKIKPADEPPIELARNDCCILSVDVLHVLTALTDAEILQVALPA